MKLVAIGLGAIVALTNAMAAETQVSVEGPSGTLRGTLSSPDGGPKPPVAIIIPGSGPTDSDGNNPLGVAAASYRLLAEALWRIDHPHRQARHVRQQRSCRRRWRRSRSSRRAAASMSAACIRRWRRCSGLPCKASSSTRCPTIPRRCSRATRVRFLVLQGTTDLQLTIQDAQRLAGARSGVTMVALDGVNHVLKLAPAERAANLATYGNSALPIAPSVVEAITALLARHP